MGIKLIALGNVLMCDDGIAIAIAKEMEQELSSFNIEVIYGETDISYCISSIKDKDFLIILDASYFGKSPGEITKLPLYHYGKYNRNTQHSLRFMDILKQLFFGIEGFILAIEISEVLLHYGLSRTLEDKVGVLAKEAFIFIINELEYQNKRKK